MNKSTERAFREALKALMRSSHEDDLMHVDMAAVETLIGVAGRIAERAHSSKADLVNNLANCLNDVVEEVIEDRENLKSQIDDLTRGEAK